MMEKNSLSSPQISVFLRGLRQSYSRQTLEEKTLHSDPLDQFTRWFEEALACPLILEANAMILSTAGKNGQVTSRTVLLKGYDKEGFQFFTHSTSQKGQQISENPQVALLFYWASLERQIKITGCASLLPRTLTEEYFSSRPRENQLGAWASDQSKALALREQLEERLQALETRFANKKIPPPPSWNGYRVEPHSIEFWQGRPNRLHDRLRYTKEKNGEWLITRLNP